MKISPLFVLPLLAVAIAGCNSTEPATNATTATEEVGNPMTMTTPPPEIAANSADANSAMANGAMSNGAMTNSADAPAMSNSAMSNSAMSNSAMSNAATGSTAATQSYRVRGQVTEVMAPGADGTASLMVKHENIPNFMKAMTMRVPLANAADAKKVKAGDKIVFDMKQSNTEVSNIEMLPASTELKLPK